MPNSLLLLPLLSITFLCLAVLYAVIYSGLYGVPIRLPFAAHRAEAREKLAVTVFRNISEAIMVTGPERRIEYVNNSFSRTTGYSEQEVVGLYPSILSSGKHDRDFYQTMWRDIHVQGFWEGEIWNKRKDGTLYLERLRITSVFSGNGTLLHYIGVFKDITVQKRLEEEIRHHAYYDGTTGLPNRLLLNERLEAALANAERNQQQAAVLFLDLDRFKLINDTAGHSQGDMVLKAVGERLSSLLSPEDTIARVGGDEFIVLLGTISDPNRPVHIAERFIEAVSQPIFLEGQEHYLNCSIGISCYPADGTDAKTLIRHADKAMFISKKEGRGQYRVYSSLNLHDDFSTSLELDLRRAIDQNQLMLYYQPKVNADTGTIAGVEALVRWNHPTHGPIPPDRFIPLAEESGLIIELDQWVFRSVCEQVTQWHRDNRMPLIVSVNLSMLSFQHAELPRYITRVLEETRVDPRQIELELTESTVMSHLDLTLSTLRQLKEMGLQIALDDFGTGYSSLSYLSKLPIQTVKIDKSFIRDLTVDCGDQTIVKSIIQLAHNLNMNVVAEGVESADQLIFLREHQCEQIQGYYYSPPLPEPDFVEYVAQQQAELLV
ncbi:GGDEF and EAL domain-containing protein [Cohnella lubricantis]|uniref:EAL domain-containing protein n=1 Tax=Cohnella lubricantis TaxID=2163172 RepID=A0A841THT0_9BACL|nr:GGDEF and EAL domain-containing protein [Cohnella lubricantis]MBB6678507.1 EAL domain-containing protein [Cohnella lubricantis]MBP2118430.1 diguanylate cyclase (GGDEF)-like protein/PAS domain S-box-containing protein [Cohnella lubricantis]